MSSSADMHQNSGVPAPHRRLFSLLRPEKLDIGIICLFSIITGLLYLSTPLAVDAVVQNIAFGGQQQVYVQTLLIFSATLFIFLGLLSLISAAQHSIAELIQQRIFVRISADLAFRLPRLKWESFEKSKSVELINRFLDVATLQKSSALILLDAVNVLLSAIIGMVVLAFYHPYLLAFDFILIVSLLVVFFVLGRKGVDTSIDESYSKHAVGGWFEQVVMFPFLFKWEQAKSYSMKVADQLVNDYLTKRKNHYRVLIRQIMGLLAIQAMASSLLLAIGGWLVLSGELTLGQLVASELIVSAIVAALVNLGKHVEAWYDAMAVTDKLGSLVDLDVEQETGEKFHPKENGFELSIRDLRFAYGNQEPIFEKINLEIKESEIIGITGPVGAGAGTLLEILYGLRPVKEGMIFLNGQDMKHLNIVDIRSRVILIRGVELFEGTILDNVRLGNDSITISKVNEALDAVGLLDKIRELPDGVNSQLKMGGRPLSDSERIELCVARALLAKPDLLLIDKILDGLDPESSACLFEALFECNSLRTVIIASRDRNILGRCPRVYQLESKTARRLRNKDTQKTPVIIS